ncbi:MAG: molybdopterin-dependent oxidoreductase [Steroidobacteraceae bacterium]
MSYSAAHWGVYEFEAPATGAQPQLRPYAGDPDPAPLGLDQLDARVAALRVKAPAVRRSWLDRGPGAATELRGKEPFIEVDWDTAARLVAGEVDRVRRQFGNAAIFGGSYGWASAGRFHRAQGQLHRFLALCGGFVRSVDSYSLGAGSALMPYVCGDINDLHAAHTAWPLLAEHTELFVAFGGVPLKNARVSSGGATDHRARAALEAMARRDVRFVNVSPVRDSLETGGTVEWLPIRPNTDAALMLALAFVVREDPRFDRSFLDRCTVGYEPFETYLTGKADGVPKTPAWAARITGIRAERIESLAREMLGKRTMLNVAWSLQRAAHGEQPYWMVVTLAAMLGQIGLPGGGYGLGYGSTNAIGSPHRRLPGPSLPAIRNPVSAFIPVARIADLLLRPGETFTYRGGTHTYPDIKLVYWAGGNPFHHHQDLHRLEQGWQRPQTIVFHEQYWTAAARRADIVLPATLALERNDIGCATREGLYVAMRRAVPPQGEARDDHAIFAAIAEHLGLRERFTEGLSPQEWLERLYAENARRVTQYGVTLPPFEEFWDRGLVDLSAYDTPQILHEEFRADPQAHPLPTPSGRIEITSREIASFGLEDCPGHPVWREPYEWLAAGRAHPLHLISDQPARRLHSQLDRSPYSQAGKVAGREPVTLNTADAAARGIASGDLVELFNSRGRCIAGAIVSDDVMPGVVRLSTGAWWDCPDGTLERSGNPNALTLDRGASSFSQGCSAQTCLVEARRFSGEAPAIEIDRPPRILRR